MLRDKTSTELWWSGNSSSRSQVQLMASFSLLCGSPAPREPTAKNIRPPPPAHEGSRRLCQSKGRSWNVAGRYGQLAVGRQASVGTRAVREHTSVFTFVYGKVGLTPRLFLAWYTEFRLRFLLLRSSQTAKASEDSTGIGPASLPPDPPAPTPVGGT